MVPIRSAPPDRHERRAAEGEQRGAAGDPAGAGPERAPPPDGAQERVAEADADDPGGERAAINRRGRVEARVVADRPSTPWK